MTLLFDQNLSFKLCRLLSDLWPASEHVRTLELGDADDRMIWAYAARKNLTIVTQDVDFANMSILYGPPPKVIWLRCGNQPTAFIEHLMRDHRAEIEEFDANPGETYIELWR